MESYHIARQNARLDSCVVVGAHFTRADSNKYERLCKEEVYAAVVHALNTHAALSARTVRQSDAAGKKKSSKEVYVFERTENVNLEKHVHFLDESSGEKDEDIAALIQHQFTQPMASVPSPDPENRDIDKDAEEDKTLWRLTVTPSNTVLFAWNHCLGDGQSGLAVLRTLLDGLNSPSSVLPPGFDPKAVKPSTNLTLAPRIEELTDVSPSLLTILSTLANLFIPPSLSSGRKVWSGNPVPASVPPFETRARHLSIPPERVSQILAAARAHQTTLTAVLYVLASSVLSDLVAKEDKTGRWKKLSVIITISLRPLARLPPTIMGENVSFHRSTPRLAPPKQTQAGAFDWTSASAFSETLHASIPKSREIIGTIKILNGKYEPFFKGKLGKKREASFEISNVGVFKLDLDLNADSKLSETSPKRWTISESYFAQDDGTAGAAIKMNVAGSPSGSVNIVVTWGKDAVDDAFAEAFLELFSEALERLILSADAEKSG